MSDTHQDFDTAYWLHQPAPVRALQEPRSDAEQVDLIQSLMRDGFQIDGPIMFNRWGPYQTMWFRQYYGWTFVPALNEDPTGVITSAELAVGNRPHGSIRVSTNIADYPPIDPPPPPADHVPPPAGYIGSCWGGGVYQSRKGDPNPDGAEVTRPGDGVVFIKHRVSGFGGIITSWYTRKVPLDPPEPHDPPGPPPTAEELGW